VLLQELLGLELAYRVRRGERPTLAEYRQRFPKHDTALDVAFREEALPANNGTGAESVAGQEPGQATQPEAPGSGDAGPPFSSRSRYQPL
jgi:hypothetical protein